MTTSKSRRARFEDPFRFFSRMRTKVHSFWLRVTYPFAALGSKFSAHHTSDIEREIAHRISLGNSVTLYKNVWLNVSVDDELNEPAITLEDGCAIGHRTTISAKNCIHLEKNVITAQSVLIMDHSHAYEDVMQPIKLQGVSEGGRIRIGEGCWIGHGAVIVCTKGELTLGHNCVVAANALVTRSFPPYSVISGNPARVVKQFDPVQKTWVLGSSRTVEAEIAKPELARHAS
jgi:acetyltransferase-like isoleucine patch superfamily enzyme